MGINYVKTGERAFYTEVVVWAKSCTGRNKVSGPSGAYGWKRKCSLREHKNT